MFYTVEENKIKEIIYDDTHQGLVLGYITLDEAEEFHEKINIPEIVLETCLSSRARFKNSIDVYDDYSFALMNVIDVKNPDAPKDRVGFIVRKDLFLFIDLKDDDQHFKAIFNDFVNQNHEQASIEKLVERILNSLLLNGYEALEEIEHKIAELDGKIMEEKVDGTFNRELYRLKDRASTLKHYYKQLSEIGSTIIENENDILCPQEMDRLRVFANRAGRLYDSSMVVMEDLIHLRDGYNSMLDYQLNRVMKLFTVVTTIFLPLTLIVGWYGMNFSNMPELNWEYGYIAVIGLSLIVIIGCFYYFKKKKLL